MFESLGAFVYRNRWLTLVLAGAFLVMAIVVLLRGGTLTSGTIEGLEAERGQALADEITGTHADTTFLVVLRANDLEAHDPAFLQAMKASVAALRGDPRVHSVTTPDEAPGPLGARMLSGKSAFVVVAFDPKLSFGEALHAYPSLRSRIAGGRLLVACTGKVPYMHDLNETLEHDLLRAEIVSLPLALLVLLMVFRTAVAAALPVGVGALSVVGGIAVVLLLSKVTDIAQYTINVCSLIGLGVAIDYSLFTVSRYREELDAGHSYPDALARAVGHAGRVVAFSGIAVGTGLSGLLFFRGSYLFAMGVGGAIVVVLAVVFALTFLPALLAVLGPRIHAWKLPGRKAQSGEGFWNRTALRVMEHPVKVLVPTLAVLLLMGVPFFHLRLAAADVRVLDRDVEARRAYEWLRESFPDIAANRISVVVSFPSAPALDPLRFVALDERVRRIARMPNVKKVESITDVTDAMPSVMLAMISSGLTMPSVLPPGLDPPSGATLPPGLKLPPGMTMPSPQDFARAAMLSSILSSPPPAIAPLVEAAKKMTVGERVVVVHVITDSAPESTEARALVRELRAERSVGDGSLSVFGQTANDIDSTAFILDRTPRAVALVVVVTVLVLFALLRSVILPLKAVVMNFVSIAGSFGSLVWIFQDGHLFVKEPRPLEPTLPVLLFCILFGLSMDYEVLMLSRMKEAWEQGRDNAHAVAEGLEKTAGVITSAAAIMVAVFAAFALARVVVIQAVGLGMAIAVALDATLVRVLLVPSTMRLFGHLNWWSPFHSNRRR